MDPLANYSISKIALEAFTLFLRWELRHSNTNIISVYPGNIDTHMTRELNVPKMSSEKVANIIIDGITAGYSHIATDPASKFILKSARILRMEWLWKLGTHAMERDLKKSPARPLTPRPGAHADKDNKL